MAEYIDREEVNRISFTDAVLIGGEVRIEKIVLVRDIEKLHAADVAPVVRCEDCRHRIYKDMGEDFGEVGGCEIFNAVLACDFFCGYGEREEGADNG